MIGSKQLMQAAAGVSTGPEGAWDLSYAYFDDPNTWDITGSQYVTLRDFPEITSDATGVFFKPDGLKMYVASKGRGRIYEYNLSVPFDMATETFVQEATITDPTGIFFKEDGLKLYNVTNNGDKVEEYDLSTAWDISTRSLSGSKSVASQTTDCRGMYISPDGTKMYVCGYTNRDVYEYTLSTAWDVTSATYVQTYNNSTYFLYITGIFFKPDGTKMFALREWDGLRSRLYEFSLSTAWDISTASYSKNVIMGAGNPRGYSLYMKDDGTGFFFGTGTTTPSARVWQHAMGGFSVSVQEATPYGMFFKEDGSKIYIIGNSGDDVNEYNLGTEWDLSTTSFVQSFSVAAQEINPYDVFFKPDGTKMYILGATTQSVLEYSLSTAWNVSTASYTQSFNISANDVNARGLSFKPDGTKMYVTGVTTDAINEYTLSTAWDISSLSYSQSFSVSAQENQPNDLFFKPDGTKVYITGAQGKDVNEYDLSTAWDVSTCSYLQNFSVADLGANPVAVSFKPDGTQMFVLQLSSDSVYSYTLGPQP